VFVCMCMCLFVCVSMYDIMCVFVFVFVFVCFICESISCTELRRFTELRSRMLQVCVCVCVCVNVCWIGQTESRLSSELRVCFHILQFCCR